MSFDIHFSMHYLYVYIFMHNMIVYNMHTNISVKSNIFSVAFDIFIFFPEIFKFFWEKNHKFIN